MIIERDFGTNPPLHHARCWKSELKDGQEAGTYDLVDTCKAAELGDGSDIVVMDVPGQVLFWRASQQVAYDWTRQEESGV